MLRRATRPLRNAARVVACGNSLMSYMCPRGCEFTHCDSGWLVRCSFYRVDWWADFKGTKLPSLGAFGDVSVWLRLFPAGTRKKLPISVLVSASLSASPQMHWRVCIFTCASQDDRKSPRLYWVGGGEFFVKRLCERCLFSHKSSGDSPLLSLSAVNQHHHTADGRLCLAGAHILGAYCCPQRWGCQGRMLPRVQGNIIFHIISEQ